MLEDKEYGGDIDSSRDKFDYYIADQANSDSVVTADIYSTVDNGDYFMKATVVKPIHSSRMF